MCAINNVIYQIHFCVNNFHYHNVTKKSDDGYYSHYYRTLVVTACEEEAAKVDRNLSVDFLRYFRIDGDYNAAMHLFHLSYSGGDSADETVQLGEEGLLVLSSKIHLETEVTLIPDKVKLNHEDLTMTRHNYNSPHSPIDLH